MHRVLIWSLLTHSNMVAHEVIWFIVYLTATRICWLLFYGHKGRDSYYIGILSVPSESNLTLGYFLWKIFFQFPP